MATPTAINQSMEKAVSAMGPFFRPLLSYYPLLEMTSRPPHTKDTHYVLREDAVVVVHNAVKI